MDSGCQLGAIPERTKRIHQLRREMDRIKAEIRTLIEPEGASPSKEADRARHADSLQAVTCAGCRHDEITRFMEEDLQLNPFLRGISVRGGLILDEEKRTRAWWTTTLRLTSTIDLARCIRTVKNIHRYLQQVSDLQLLTELHNLATGQDSDIDTGSAREHYEAVEKGTRMGLITAKGSGHSLTPKGWELYVTLAHLVHNHVVKLDPERSQIISQALAENLGWIHGTLDDVKPYLMPMVEKMDLLRRSGTLSPPGWQGSDREPDRGVPLRQLAHT